MDKVVPSPADAVADIPDGASLAVGGFGLSGNPMKLIEALHDRGTTDLRVVSNNCGVDDWAGKFDHLADIPPTHTVDLHHGGDREDHPDGLAASIHPVASDCTTERPDLLLSAFQSRRNA